MSTQSPAAGIAVPVGPIIVAVIGIGLIVAFLAGAQLPLVTSDRRAVAALAVLGWVGCSMGVGPVTQAIGWRDPLVLAAIGLGVVALSLIAIVALDRADVLATVAGSVGLGDVPGNRIALVALGLVMVAKVGLGAAASTR